MPNPNVPLLTAGIAGGSSLLGGAVGAISSAIQNRKMREWNEKMYGIQRKDALSDWNQQNQYNSPQQQMQRLKEAGLNPNMVYGHGADAQSSAAPRSSSVEAWRPNPVTFDPGQAVSAGLSAYQDTRMKEAQIDNLKAQKEAIYQQTALAAANAAWTVTKNSMSKFDLNIKRTLQATTLSIAQENLRKVTAGINNAAALTNANVANINARTAIGLAANERAAIQQSSNLKEAVTRILKMRSDMATSASQRQLIAAQISKINSDNTLQNMEIKLRKKGITSKDPAWQRAVGYYVNDMIVTFPKVKENAKKIWDRLTTDWKFH